MGMGWNEVVWGGVGFDMTRCDGMGWYELVWDGVGCAELGEAGIQPTAPQPSSAQPIPVGWDGLCSAVMPLRPCRSVAMPLSRHASQSPCCSVAMLLRPCPSGHSAHSAQAALLLHICMLHYGQRISTRIPTWQRASFVFDSLNASRQGCMSSHALSATVSSYESWPERWPVKQWRCRAALRKRAATIPRLKLDTLVHIS